LNRGFLGRSNGNVHPRRAWSQHDCAESPLPFDVASWLSSSLRATQGTKSLSRPNPVSISDQPVEIWGIRKRSLPSMHILCSTSCRVGWERKAPESTPVSKPRMLRAPDTLHTTNSCAWSAEGSTKQTGLFLFFVPDSRPLEPPP